MSPSYPPNPGAPRRTFPQGLRSRGALENLKRLRSGGLAGQKARITRQGWVGENTTILNLP
jgi:hypothetical protein